MKTIEELNEKWWYRLVKVVFIFAFLLTFWMPSTIVFFETYPEIDRHNTTYRIQCEDGTMLQTVYRKTQLNYNATDFRPSAYTASKNGARLVCANTHLSREDMEWYVNNAFSALNPDPPHQNYSFVLVEEKYTSSWVETIMYSVFAFVVTISLFLIARASFLYIVIKAPFWRTLIFK